MGGGSWTEAVFSTYSTSMGRSVLSDGSIDTHGVDASQMYTAHKMAKELNPYKVIRECRDSEEHPNTIPVILALDVTGSMGETAVEVAGELNKIMTELYKSVKDVEFMIMGIGDFAYDKSPLQVSQFESDIRIAEQLDKLWFEFGGGGNNYESYTAAWAFAVSQTDLDCWKRGKKGILITMGDEDINPHINTQRYESVTGTKFSQTRDIETADLFEQVKEKFDVFHINVAHRTWGDRVNKAEWHKWLGDNFVSCPVKSVPQIITQIITACANGDSETATTEDYDPISW